MIISGSYYFTFVLLLLDRQIVSFVGSSFQKITFIFSSQPHLNCDKIPSIVSSKLSIKRVLFTVDSTPVTTLLKL